MSVPLKPVETTANKTRGGNVMLYYLVYIFNMAGMTGNTALTSSIIQYVIFLVTTGVVLPYIDRLGRRPLPTSRRQKGDSP